MNKNIYRWGSMNMIIPLPSGNGGGWGKTLIELEAKLLAFFMLLTNFAEIFENFKKQ